MTSGMELRDNILVSGNADSTVKVWDIVTGQCLQTLSGPSKHQSAVTCLQVRECKKKKSHFKKLCGDKKYFRCTLPVPTTWPHAKIFLS